MTAPNSNYELLLQRNGPSHFRCSDRIKSGTDFVALHTWIIVGLWYSAMAEEPKGRVLYV